MTVVDISNITSPNIVGSHKLYGYTADIVVDESYAYVLSSRYGLCVVDISNPTLPTDVALANTGGWPVRLEKSGDFIYIANGFQGFKVIDVSDPLNPAEVGWYTTSRSAENLTVDGNIAYVADREDGLYIIQFNEPSSIQMNDHFTTPARMELYQNYPNPFNPSTMIKYNLVKSSHILLKIYNLAGQEVATLVNEFQSAGEHEIAWQPTGLPSGLYFYKIQAGELSEAKKLILQK